MKQSVAESFVRLLTARMPKDIADLCLDFVLGASHATVGAVFKVDGDQHTLFTSRGIAQDGLDWMDEHWGRLLEALRLREGAIIYRDHSLAPVVVDGALRAVFFCEGAPINEEAVAEVSFLILDAIKKEKEPLPAPLAVDAYLERMPADEIERRKILLLCSRHEWNVARVARECNASRTTVYRKLLVYGYSREQIQALRLASRARPRGATT